MTASIVSVLAVLGAVFLTGLLLYAGWSFRYIQENHRLSQTESLLHHERRKVHDLEALQSLNEWAVDKFVEQATAPEVPQEVAAIPLLTARAPAYGGPGVNRSPDSLKPSPTPRHGAR